MKRSLGEFIWQHLWQIWEPLLLRSGYDPKKYWNARGKFFRLEKHQTEIGWQHQWLEKKLKETTWTSLLEVGCGFGRNLKYLDTLFAENEKKLSGMDISAPLLRQCRTSLPSPLIQLHEGTLLSPPDIEKVDVVLTFGLLMHVPPSDINKAFENIARLSQKAAILIEETVPGSENAPESVKINPFTYQHPYKALIAKHGFALADSFINDAWGLFFIQKKTS
ncbi:MAG: hypothetical protein KCHDKBKB_01810 [Elusimicrobia bacterium]|nr:hypothetical protein [Elusimicrobiota bacterium]